MQPALDVSLADLALIVHQGRIYDYYCDNAGPLWLHGLDAVHVALGTVAGVSTRLFAALSRLANVT